MVDVTHHRHDRVARLRSHNYGLYHLPDASSSGTLHATMPYMKRVYLDHAAATPVTRTAERAFRRALSAYGNPSSPHAEGKEAKRILEDARTRIARLTEAKPEHVYLTSGATEANNIAIQGVIRALHASGASVRAVYQDGAHASIEEPYKMLAEDGVPVSKLPVMGGSFDLSALTKLIASNTVLVSVEAVSSETGARFDTRALRHALDSFRKPGEPRIYLHVDASQLPLTESIERTRLQADLMTLDAQKVGGVRGAGCLIVSSGVPLASVMQGGGQERGIRPGTPSPALAASFATALEEAKENREAFALASRNMREALLRRVLTDISEVYVNEGKENVPSIVNLSFSGRDTDYLATLLDARGFSVSTKSACETDSPDGSRAVMAQTGDASRARSTLRVSWGRKTSMRDIERFASALAHAVRFLDENRLK